MNHVTMVRIPLGVDTRRLNTWRAMSVPRRIDVGFVTLSTETSLLLVAGVVVGHQSEMMIINDRIQSMPRAFVERRLNTYQPRHVDETDYYHCWCYCCYYCCTLFVMLVVHVVTLGLDRNCAVAIIVPLVVDWVG